MNPSSRDPAPRKPRSLQPLDRRVAPRAGSRSGWSLVVAILCAWGLALESRGATASLLGWNNLGMHCMDSDYSVFSILPPYNTIEAQLIVGGKLVRSGNGYSVTYEAVADPDGSINSTSIGKGNFYDFTASLYGPLAPDQGLAGWGMPGPSNIPQSMLFEALNQPVPGVFTPVHWFRAEGIPITPYDDAGNKNPYPLLRLVARNGSGQVIARSDIVAPVSDEMDCSVCHGSKETFRENILSMHDAKEFARDPVAYGQALQAMNYRPDGLLPTAQHGQPILCAKCHASEALGTKSFGTIPPLTTSMHAMHATVHDPVTAKPLGAIDNRSACYRCHPGSDTRCLRGAMGGAIAPDGTMSMQCQSCHGGMAQVGSPDRVGWLMEPNCQSCHTGTATHNNGQIRYTSVFETNGTERVAVDSTFATNPNTPASGISLYRFSVGHGGLQCSACHGSTHAEFPATHRNDNLRNVQLQGHAGVTVECTACHTTMPSTINGGPHGMHPLGQGWVESHHDAIEQVGLAACQACHGSDHRGTVLSRVQANRSFRIEDGDTVNFYRGATVGCYTCHDGPSDDDMNGAAAPSIMDVAARTTAGVPVDLVLPVGNASAVLRVITQPAHGAVGLSNHVATYFPDEGFTGTDTFTFAAYDGAKNSALATGTITVVAGDAHAQAPLIDVSPASRTVAAGAPASMTVAASGGVLHYQWFRDGWPLAGANEATLTFPAVTMADAGTYVVLVTDAVGSTASSPALLTVANPVVITRQPVNATVIAGSTVTFSVTATGTGPIAYQWTRNGSAISGATGASLRLSNVTLGQAGNYQVRVSNPAGSVLSGIAVLTVQAAPSITRQPQSQTVVEGRSVTFSVSATGFPAPTFQWYKNSVAVAGATGATLVIPVVTRSDAGRYSVRVSNRLGSVTSTAAQLTVQAAAPTITGFSPTSGGVGAAVTLSGANLTGATSVKFNGTVAAFAVVGPGTIIAGVPRGATTGKISITTAGGTVVSTSNFTVGSRAAVPLISSFTPASGPVGAKVVLTGANLGATTGARLGTTTSSYTVLSASQVQVAIPASGASGSITLTTPGGAVSSGLFAVTR
ncbi:MAG: immunoglobulin domain-containing protein [Verrucomicrobiales bacterium]|nr:immunoglobulin domain-containing protein [Verrucomicrobiales bacterium]